MASRAELVDLLETRLEHLGKWHDRFYLAKMSKVKFGIVDSDRADFLGLSFTVDMIGGGGSWCYLPADESLELLKKVGQTQNLEGRYCWVYDKDGWINFVKILGA